MENEDSFGTSDSYVRIGVYKDGWISDDLLGEQKTKVVVSLNPAWNQEFEFPITSTHDILVKLDVLDEDPLSDDEMGDAEIKLNDYQLSSTYTPIVKTVNHRLLHTSSKIYVSLKVQ